jgi:TolB-like protein/DNA-binding SARP family transcriptional activator
MVSIRLLGGFSFSANGVTSARLGPKLQGLIALLAMSRGAAVPRSRLSGLLWGERDEKHAHHNLSQALTTIRAALGPDATALESKPDGVWLTRGSFDLDVDAFEQAAQSDDSQVLREASQLYRGEFLQGVEIREAGFEEWQLSERYRLGELAAGAFARLLEQQTAEGAVEAAIATARKLIGIAPLNEAAHARLITLYASLGRTALADSHYQHCSDLLRRELGQAPSEVLQSAYAAARRAPRGEGALPVPAPRLRDSSGTEVGGHRTARWLRDRWVTVTVAGTLLLLAGIWSYDASRTDSIDRSYRDAPWDMPAAPSIAVLPFANHSSDEHQAYFASGITRDIITDLSKFSSLFVIASNSTARYRTGATDVSQIARELRVRYVLEGNVQRFDSKVQIHAFLSDATTGRHVWAERFERPAEELFTVQKRIAQTIAGLLASKSGELQRADFERIRAIPTKHLQAYELYVRGVEHQRRRTKEDNALARELFRKAIQADPNYARAMAECALTYLTGIFQGWSDSREDALQRAEALARQAIEVDPSEEWGFAALGLIHQLSDRNEAALKLFERAHSLNPNDYGIRQALGYAVTYAGAADRGVDLLELSEWLDPYHTTPSYLAMAYFFARRYEDVLARLNQYPELHASRTFWLYRAAASAELDRIDEARQAVGKALELDSTLTVQSERARRLQLGLAPAYADHLSTALRKAGLPEGEAEARRKR